MELQRRDAALSSHTRQLDMIGSQLTTMQVMLEHIDGRLNTASAEGQRRDQQLARHSVELDRTEREIEELRGFFGHGH